MVQRKCKPNAIKLALIAEVQLFLSELKAKLKLANKNRSGDLHSERSRKS